MGKNAVKFSIADLQNFAKRGMIAQAEIDRLTGVANTLPEKKLRGAKVPNKTEEEFGRILLALINKPLLTGPLEFGLSVTDASAGYHGPLMFEAVKLRIAGNCYYTPDWMCFSRCGSIPAFFEVKGAHVWDDAKVKFKAAAEMHKWAKFEMWQKKQGQWNRIL